jgi:hypothetical protein
LQHQNFTICLLKDGLLGRHYMEEALQNTAQQWRANFTCR